MAWGGGAQMPMTLFSKVVRSSTASTMESHSSQEDDAKAIIKAGPMYQRPPGTLQSYLTLRACQDCSVRCVWGALSRTLTLAHTHESLYRYLMSSSVLSLSACRPSVCSLSLCRLFFCVSCNSWCCCSVSVCAVSVTEGLCGPVHHCYM